METEMNSAHLHLLVNHLPIIGFAFALILLAATFLRNGDRGMFLASVLVIVISGVGALAAQLTGEPAEEFVEHLPDVPKNLIETHEGAALIATSFAAVTTVLAILLCFISILQEGRVGTRPLSILLIASLLTLGTMCYAGSTGGKIRHTEIRDSFIPSTTGGIKERD
jgi:uncharacterized membrane protein